jgi:hypothetical protein
MQNNFSGRLAVSAALLISAGGTPASVTGPQTGRIRPMTNWNPVFRLPREFFFDQLSKMICQNTFLEPLDDFVQETAH